MIGSFQVAGSQLAKVDLLTDKVNCCLALLVITINVDNSFVSSAAGGLRRRVSPRCPSPVPVPHPWDFVPRSESHVLSDAQAALQRPQSLLPFSPFFFLTYSLHIDRALEYKSETQLCSALKVLPWRECQSCDFPAGWSE